ncbi:NADPH-dependent oxidoreductase [Gulosibacter molinativorax]|uniref:NADPH-dependent oxidoreductase n=1 Tax=Gulosibacter molinativorax TaxID=256821 RepID=A0ABT7CBT3_9MICO|nr:NADPH-dependent oxidoreductase [Gulosibacter molinativorax]MDJ1372207.1 NADPH-dependent oxidoreductase [Gulosibacter molinativorax]QUY60920.1 NfnB protein [Gulosibacter molinativorax]
MTNHDAARESDPSTNELVERRYGAAHPGPLADGNATINLQLRHRSVRKFLPAEVTDAQLELIVAAAQSGSQSSNLQVWSVVAVRDQARKDRISAALGGHPYIEHCSVFLVWTADFNRNTRIVEAAHGTEVDSVGYLENTLVSFVDSGIAGQNALLAAESLGLGGVFVGSVRNNPLELSRELNLPEYVFPVVGLAVGVPDPTERASTKPRLPQRAVLHHEQYDAGAWESASREYEQHLADYYADYGRENYSWAFTLNRRIGSVEGMHGRHQIREWLAAKGFDSE